MNKSAQKSVKLVVGEGASIVESLGEVPGDAMIDLVIADGVTEIKSFAFRFCKRIASVVLPQTLQTIGMYAFDECSGLHSVSIPNSVSKMGMHAFYDCTMLESVKLSSGLKSVDSWAFSKCVNLKSVDIPEGVEVIGAEAFRGCRALSKVTLPESLVKIGDRAFKGCRKIVGIAIPQGVQTIGEEAIPQPKKSMVEWSPEERKEHLDRIVGKREKILTAIQNDRAIPISNFSEKIQKMAAECGLAPDDTVSFKHTDSYVMCCPCAMQFPALTRLSVCVPKRELLSGESGFRVVYLDEDRSKDWAVVSVGDEETFVAVYASVVEAKTTRFGKFFSLVSRLRCECK